jgi:hypothetical protein
MWQSSPWALLFAAPLVPLLDWLQDSAKRTALVNIEKEEFAMKRQVARVMLLLVSVAALWPTDGHAFCGFYVARADSTLYNSASQVVVVRLEVSEPRVNFGIELRPAAS